MRIDELLGIKGTDFKSAVDQAKPAGPDDSKSSGLNQAVEELKKNGWNVLGQGYSAYVLEHPSKSYVLRLSYYDKGYMKFLKFIKANAGNPHVPKTKGLGAQLSPTVFAIRIEKLTPIKYNDPIFQQYVDPNLDPDFESLEDPDNEAFLRQHYPELLQTFKSLRKIEPNNDINITNIMRRGNVLVVTDPFV